MEPPPSRVWDIPELLSMIVDELPHNDLLTMARVCSAFWGLVVPIIWRTIPRDLDMGFNTFLAFLNILPPELQDALRSNDEAKVKHVSFNVVYNMLVSSGYSRSYLMSLSNGRALRYTLHLSSIFPFLSTTWTRTLRPFFSSYNHRLHHRSARSWRFLTSASRMPLPAPQLCNVSSLAARHSVNSPSTFRVLLRKHQQSRP